MNLSSKKYRGSIKQLDLFIVIIVSAICFFIPASYDWNFVNPFYCLLIAINSFISLYYMLFDRPRSFTISKLINLFIFVFFILANSIQYATQNVVLTFHYKFTHGDYIMFQFLVMFILIFYNFIHDLYLKKYESNNNLDDKIKRNYNNNNLLFLSLVVTFFILALYRFNVLTLFFRGFTESYLSEHGVKTVSFDSTSSGLIFDKIIRAFPWAIYILSCCINYPKKKRRVLFWLMVITVFPLGLSRNAAAMYWIPVLILKFAKYLKGNRFIYLMLIGIFVLFPFMDNFRYFDGNVKFKFSLDYLNTMNMDASQIFMAVIKENLLTYGYQLLGVFFFFFPRSLWLSKPVGSGYYVVEYMDGWFPNVSMPYFGEGFINFGIPGLLIFLYFIAYFSGRLDSNFWSSYRKIKFSPQSGFYLIILSAIIFIMRGDLLSSFAFTIGTCLCYYLAYKTTLIKLKI